MGGLGGAIHSVPVPERCHQHSNIHRSLCLFRAVFACVRPPGLPVPSCSAAFCLSAPCPVPAACLHSSETKHLRALSATTVSLDPLPSSSPPRDTARRSALPCSSAVSASPSASAPGPMNHLDGESPPAAMEHDDYFGPSRDDQHRVGVQPIDDSDTDMAASATASSSRAAMFASPTHAHARKPSRMSRSGAPRPINTPTSPLSSSIPHNLLPSAPASPPTPAPSPTPTQRVPDWSTAAEYEDSHIKSIRARFGDMNRAERLRLLGELLNLCDSQELSFVAEFVSPRLKKDPFMVLPTELCLRVRFVPSYTAQMHADMLVDPRMRRRPHHTLARIAGLKKMARAGQRRWRLEAALQEILLPGTDGGRAERGGRPRRRDGRRRAEAVVGDWRSPIQA
jgi:hypothetical protein